MKIDRDIFREAIGEASVAGCIFCEAVGHNSLPLVSVVIPASRRLRGFAKFN